jgi:hypothetical protein
MFPRWASLSHKQLDKYTFIVAARPQVFVEDFSKVPAIKEGAKIKVVVRDDDDPVYINLSTKVLETKPGAILQDAEAVFAAAEETIKLRKDRLRVFKVRPALPLLLPCELVLLILARPCPRTTPGRVWSPPFSGSARLQTCFC